MSDPASSSGAPLTGMNLPDSFGVLLLSTIIVSAYVPCHLYNSGSQYQLPLTDCGHLARLYGITVLQTLYYYERFPKDPWRLKTAVRMAFYVSLRRFVEMRSP